VAPDGLLRPDARRHVPEPTAATSVGRRSAQPVGSER